ncbi:histidinol dehydrogenase [Microbacterium halophytorum]|uniref:histidinol dehydrogenase n=1 Tax=Microbacterium halophytorum TaxID=2067568 RepID=UPI0018E0B2F3|nr:histidinol dehydrogenase [Microbacterium halophytorum]
MQWVMRALTWLGAAVAGAVFGIAGTICYASLVVTPVIGGVAIPLPFGLLISGVACLGLMLAVRLLADDRIAVLATGLGMLLALFLFSGRGPGGSVVVPQAAEGALPLGMIWSWALAVIVLVVVAWPDLRGARDAHARRLAQASARAQPEA